MHVHIWFDKCELSLFTPCKCFPRCSVTIVCNLKLSSVDSYDASDKESVLLDIGLHSLQEHSAVFQIILQNSKVSYLFR